MATNAINLNQHHLDRKPVHRNVATLQTSEVVDRAPKNCNSYPDAIFKSLNQDMALKLLKKFINLEFLSKL